MGGKYYMLDTPRNVNLSTVCRRGDENIPGRFKAKGATVSEAMYR